MYIKKTVITKTNAQPFAKNKTRSLPSHFTPKLFPDESKVLTNRKDPADNMCEHLYHLGARKAWQCVPRKWKHLRDYVRVTGSRLAIPM